MRHRILVVEDDPLSRELLCDWLETEDYEVVTAADLQAAFNAVHDQSPHLVLLDVKLGTDDGLELASWMRKQPEFQYIPVIAVTAHAMVTEQERISRSGCNAVVPKPVDFALLAKQLHSALSTTDCQ